MAQVFVEAVAENRGVEVAKVLSDFGRGDVLIGRAAVAAGMADGLGTFEGTLAKLAAGKAPARCPPAPEGVAPRVGMPVAPVPARPVAPPVPAAVVADRARMAAIIEAAPPGAEAERDEAIRSRASVDEFRRSLGAFAILSAMRASRGG